MTSSPDATASRARWGTGAWASSTRPKTWPCAASSRSRSSPRRQAAATAPTDDRERVLREASLTAQINHPNVVTIHDYGCVEAGADSYCYIAMELLSGETLGERLRRQRTGLSRAETILVMTQVVRGLRAAHRRGLVHRDLKPDNIMLTPGDDGDDSVRILDFGLAREMIPGPARGFGDGGDVAGTPEYMSPEQVAGREVDYRADLYAFGILLYECVTGAPPFTGDNPFRVARSHVRDAVPPCASPARGGGPRSRSRSSCASSWRSAPSPASRPPTISCTA
ncbi:MAG: serine/threonine-protein kinase [Polyangiaceae bacterium]